MKLTDSSTSPMRKKLLSLVFSLAMTSLAFARTCQVAPDAPVLIESARNTSSWQSKYQRQKLLASRTNASVLLIGDSMIERWPGDMLMTAFNTASVLNLGIGGDRTQNVLWRLSQLDLSHHKPAYTILLVGTNNLSASDSACSIAAGIEKIAQRIHQMLPETKILLVGILARGESLGYRKDDIAQINSSLKALQDHQTIFIDPSSIVERSAEGKENFIPDQLHLSNAGYRELTQLLLKHMAKSQPPRR